MEVCYTHYPSTWNPSSQTHFALVHACGCFFTHLILSGSLPHALTAHGIWITHTRMYIISIYIVYTCMHDTFIIRPLTQAPVHLHFNHTYIYNIIYIHLAPLAQSGQRHWGGKRCHASHGAWWIRRRWGPRRWGPYSSTSWDEGFFWDISAEENVILYDFIWWCFGEDWTKKNLNIL